MAPRNITPGLPYTEALKDGIKSSKVFVLVYSSNSNSSAQVIQEVDRVVHNGLSIINFRLENVPLSEHCAFLPSLELNQNSTSHVYIYRKGIS